MVKLVLILCIVLVGNSFFSQTINIIDYDTSINVVIDSIHIYGGMSADDLVSALGRPSWMRKRKVSLKFDRNRFKYRYSEMRYDKLGMLFILNVDGYLSDIWINISSNEKNKSEKWVYSGELKLNDSLIDLTKPITFDLDTLMNWLSCKRNSNACLLNIPYYFWCDNVVKGKSQYSLTSEYDQVEFHLNEAKEITWIWIRNPRGFYKRNED